MKPDDDEDPRSPPSGPFAQGGLAAQTSVDPPSARNGGDAVTSTKIVLAPGIFVELHADGRAVILTTEARGRVTQRIVLSLEAFSVLQALRFGEASPVVETTKKLRA